MLDAAIVVAYLAGTLLIGGLATRHQRNVADYFVSGRRMPWWAVMGSIVATETSTVTFISVPGYAYTGDLTFLQLVMGYMLGRIAVTILFVPAYFRGELLTVYQLLGERFGGAVRRLTAGLFLATRSLADGFRLFATGLVVAAVALERPDLVARARAWVPGADPTLVVLVGSVALLSLVTIAYTYLGGMRAVIWTDVCQLVVYLVGAVAAAAVLIDRIPGGWEEVVSAAAAAGKWRVFDFTWDLTRSYTFWSGLVGGAFLTTATHGTDQLMVQRYLASPSPRAAGAALLASGIVVFAQFALFLVIGVLLYVYYERHAPGEALAFVVAGQVQADRIFPHFIATHLPKGLLGLVVAAVLAAAMSTLSSSLNSSAAAAVADFYAPLSRRRHDAAELLRVSKRLTVFWGLVQLAVACAAIGISRRVVDEVLGIASFTNGVVLGVFLLGTLGPRVGTPAALVGIAVGAATMLAVRIFTAVSWQWYVMIGSLATLAAGLAAARLRAGDR
jgi:SSS family solute:Na+ symporter